jgi:hypothetical protein
MMSTRRRVARPLSIALGSVLLAVATAAAACGFEDPSSIGARRGFLNFVYPESLHVGTAVWQAQLAGKLPRDPLAQRAELTPEARGAFRMMQASAALRALGARLASEGGDGAPNVSVVLLSSVMWSRFEPQGKAVNANVHVTGPEEGDVVLVTDTPPVRALADGSLEFSEALASGLVRLYGDPVKVEAARRWLGGAGRL